MPSHNAKRQRTRDVEDSASTDQSLNFSELLLSESILKGLNEAGYLRPSPIQLKAIPIGKFGVDLIAQAKSGTGKTCVFSVISLENVLSNDQKNTNLLKPQVLILAPTREIALQIRDVICTIGKYTTLGAQNATVNSYCQAFIGGTSMSTDVQNLRFCKIVVGSPGRIKALMESGHLSVRDIQLFILDEADKLFDESFRPSIHWIYSKLPQKKQVLAFSATYPPEVMEIIRSYMKDPQYIVLVQETPTLEGIKQYYHQFNIPSDNKNDSYQLYEAKVAKLLELLSKMSFHQCLVFCNSKGRAQQLSLRLSDEGWPSNFIAGGQPQEDRIRSITALREFQLRVLVSTDLTARGIDVEHVNLVVNLDVPGELETYLHRIGRTGRFGTYGVSVTFINSEKDRNFLQLLEETYKTNVEELPDEIPAEYYKYNLEAEQDRKALQDLEQLGGTLKEQAKEKEKQKEVEQRLGNGMKLKSPMVFSQNPKKNELYKNAMKAVAQLDGIEYPQVYLEEDQQEDDEELADNNNNNNDNNNNYDEDGSGNTFADITTDVNPVDRSHNNYYSSTTSLQQQQRRQPIPPSPYYYHNPTNTPPPHSYYPYPAISHENPVLQQDPSATTTTCPYMQYYGRCPYSHPPLPSSVVFGEYSHYYHNTVYQQYPYNPHSFY